MINKFKLNQFSAFSLAEVLITLVVIGVIAALVIPLGLHNHHKQEYEVSLKKALTTLNQALFLQYALDGTRVSDYDTAEEVIDNIFMKRMSVIKTAVNFTGWPAGKVFYTADGQKFCIYGTKGPCTSDGTEPCFSIYLDVNGERKPNKYTDNTLNPQDIYEATLYASRVLPIQAAEGLIYDSGSNTYHP